MFQVIVRVDGDVRIAYLEYIGDISITVVFPDGSPTILPHSAFVDFTGFKQ